MFSDANSIFRADAVRALVAPLADPRVGGVAGDQVYKLHLIPSGILYPGTLCVIGNGVVVDPAVLCGELDHLEERGVSVEVVRLAPYCQPSFTYLLTITVK